MSKAEKIQLKKRMAAEPNPKLDDILNRKQLDRHIANQIVKVATHPTLPLYLYDYTSLCERRDKWDGVTVTTRGLLRDNKGTVIGRPFQKFFSWGGKSTSAVPGFRWADDWYGVEKVDGTMIVASQFEGQLVLTTRASFDAWQIAAARKLWPEGLLPPVGITWMLEYCGPDNQIVIEYDKPTLYFLGAINNWTGEDCLPGAFDRIENLATPRTFMSVETVEELQRQMNNDGTVEGFVVVAPRPGRPSPRLKVKYAAYNQRHIEIFRQANP